MYRSGLVSISFRGHSPAEILEAAARAGLSCIEWGSDVHAPCGDVENLEKIVKLQEKYGISCCSYGTYFRLGVTPVEELPGYIHAAKRLGTQMLRLWCGSKPAEACTPEEKETLFAQCREAAAMAEAAGVVLSMECHIKSFTETAAGALELMQAVASPAFRMYWQPNQFRTVEENRQYARALRDYITHIHVFQWKGKARFPLADGVEEWKCYLSELTGSHTLLLEFMPDDDLRSLPMEAAALRELMGGSL